MLPVKSHLPVSELRGGIILYTMIYYIIIDYIIIDYTTIL